MLLRYTAHALKDLQKLDKAIAKRIVSKIQENSELSDPLSRARSLRGPLRGLYRYRIGEYRVLFEVIDDSEHVVLMVLRVKHRKEIYQ